MTTVVTVITDDDIAVGDAVSAQLEKMWGWYLAGASSPSSSASS